MDPLIQFHVTRLHVPHGVNRRKRRAKTGESPNLPSLTVGAPFHTRRPRHRERGIGGPSVVRSDRRMEAAPILLWDPGFRSQEPSAVCQRVIRNE